MTHPLKEFRKRHGLGQKEMGFNRSTISKIENGRTPSFETMRRLTLDCAFREQRGDYMLLQILLNRLFPRGPK